MRRVLFLILIAALLGITTSAQGPRGDTSPAEAVERASAAHGNKWTSSEIADWRGDGKLTLFGSDGPKMTFEMTLLRKGELAVQRIIKQPVGELRQGSDGIRSWESIAGFYTPSAQGHTLHFIESQTVRAPQRLFKHQSEGLFLRDAGNDGKARVIEAIDRRGKRTNYSIDTATSRITKLEFVVGEARDAFSGKPVDVVDTYVFSDYRTVQGVLTPFKIERFNNGNKTEEMQFKEVKYNAGLSDQDFRR